MNHQSHSLRFQSLFNAGRSLCFPCDAAGHVALQELSERARNNYFFARACVGREFAMPCVEPHSAPASAPFSNPL